MKHTEPKRFVASYSGGKDCMLAIYRAIQGGMTPQKLLTTYNTDMDRSWFHGVPEPLLHAVSAALDVPVRLIRTSGDMYAQSFEAALAAERDAGAQACVFGDIDIEEHFEWCEQRCAAAKMEAVFPLRGEGRKSLVLESIDVGLIANITIVDTRRMSAEYLGKPLTRELTLRLEAEGVDICGENGEYHTFVSDGPIFRAPVAFEFGEMIMRDRYAVLPLKAAGTL